MPFTGLLELTCDALADDGLFTLLSAQGAVLRVLR
jgi:hypothetical protein